MPRKPCFNLLGIPRHVIQRGNNREPCFYTEEDYRRHKEKIEEIASRQTRLGLPARPRVEEEQGE